MRGFRKNKKAAREARSVGYPFRVSAHPLFLIVGIWYCLRGELFLFLTSCIVALQHECAHAFAAARLGYKLNRIVLMPFGAVLDGDLRSVAFRDEAYIALCGPLCNLFTAFFFGAVWWFAPTVYAFTDIACYASLAIALINLLPAYPLDGGRILRAALFETLYRKGVQNAEKRAERICRAVTLVVAVVLIALGATLFLQTRANPSALIFGIFLLVSAFGNGNERAYYEKLDFSCKDALKRGVELKRVAILQDTPIKDTLKYLVKGAYLVLEVYDGEGEKVFEVPQNELAEWFLRAETPSQSLESLQKRKNGQKKCKNA